MKNKNKSKQTKFEVVEQEINFHCKYGVYTNKSNSSICYCTDTKRAELVADALTLLYALYPNGKINSYWRERFENGEIK